MDEIRFTIALSAAEFLAYYEGRAKTVVVRAHDGRTVALPAARLRAFVTASGVHGEFRLRLDDRNAVIDLQRIT